MPITVLLMVLTLGVPSQAQAQKGENASCISADEKVFKPGSDGVKPPQLQEDKKSKDAPPTGNFSIELVVNSEGRICSARPLSGPDLASAKQLSDFIVSHWRFKPATRQGKAVAVKFTTNFASPH